MPQPKPTPPPVDWHIAAPIVAVACAGIIAMAATRSAGWVFGIMLGAFIAYLVVRVLVLTGRLLH